MGYLLDTSLKVTIAMLFEVGVNDALEDMLLANDKGDKERFEKSYLEYTRQKRLVELGYEMMLDGKLKEWDLKWSAKNGHLCNMDFEWFKEMLEKEGITKDNYRTEWYKTK